MGERFSPSEFFDVASVALIGVSEEPGSIGGGLYKSISDGFPGEIYCVNPKYITLWNRPCYPSVLQLPAVPSHAVIAVARQRVTRIIQECVQLGIRNIVVISAGFKEADAQGAAWEQEITAQCRQKGISLLGPNTLGFIDTAVPCNCTFLPDHFAPGPVSVISQSGGVGMALLAALKDQRCGIAKWVGIGNEAVIDAVGVLRLLAEDPATRVIAVCFEGLQDLPGFLRTAKTVNRTKPIVLLRDGKGAAGMRAAASHTGTMAQSSAVMTGLVEQFGLIEARSCRECAVMLKALSISPPPQGNRIAILTNTAGPSILAADQLEPAGAALPQPSAELQAAIDREAGLPMRLKNPADISSHGLTPRNYGIAARQLLSSAEYDLLLGFFSLNPHLNLPDMELIDAARQAGKPVVACFLTSEEMFRGYDLKPEQAGIPCYCDPQDAAAAAAALVARGRTSNSVEESPSQALTEERRGAVARRLAALENAGHRILTEQESRELLSLAGIGGDAPVLTAAAEEAAAAAERWGYPVALKLHSHVVTHKSDAGGVRLNIQSRAELLSVYDELLTAMRRLDPAAALTVQPMRPEGFELMIGAVRAEGAGPLVMAGMGGVYAEVLRDTAFRMAPIGAGQALSMLDSLRCTPILNGFRGQPLDKAGAADLLQRLSELMTSFPQLQEIDINPCRVYPDGTAVLDARVVLRDPASVFPASTVF